MRHMQFVAGIAFLMIAGWASIGSPQEVVLSTDRVSYVLHEPVGLRLDHVNRTATPVTVADDSVWLRILQPSGSQRRVGLWQERMDEVIDSSPLQTIVQPGDTYRRTRWLALDRDKQWIFPSPGRWRIALASEDATAIEIEVVAPTTAADKMATGLFTQDACVAFVTDGHESRDAMPALRTIVEKYPLSTFAPYAAWGLSRNQWAVDRQNMDWAKEREWLSAILRTPQEHPLRPAAMYAIARYYRFQKGQKEQARRTANELIKAYPWSTWAHTAKSQYKEEVSATLVPYSEDPAMKLRREAPSSPKDGPSGKTPDGKPSGKEASAQPMSDDPTTEILRELHQRPVPPRSNNEQAPEPSSQAGSPQTMSGTTPADPLNRIVPPQWKPKKPGNAVFEAVPANADAGVVAVVKQYFELLSAGKLREAYALLADDYVSDRGARDATVMAWHRYADRYGMPDLRIAIISVEQRERYHRPRELSAAAKEWTEPLWVVVAEVVQEANAAKAEKRAQMTMLIRRRDGRLELVSEAYETPDKELQLAALALCRELDEQPAAKELHQNGQRITLPQLLAASFGPDISKDRLRTRRHSLSFEVIDGRKHAVLSGRVMKYDADPATGAAPTEETPYELVFRLDGQTLVLVETRIPARRSEQDISNRQ